MSYNAILDSEIEPDAPVDTSLVGRLRDNPFSAMAREPGAPGVNFVALSAFHAVAGVYTFVVPATTHLIEGVVIGGGQAGGLNGSGFGGLSKVAVNGADRVTADGGKPTASFSTAGVFAIPLGCCATLYTGYSTTGDTLSASNLHWRGGNSPLSGAGGGIAGGAGSAPGAGGGGNGLGIAGGFSGFGVKFYIGVTPGDTITMYVGAGGVNGGKNGADGLVELRY